MIINGKYTPPDRSIGLPIADDGRKTYDGAPLKQKRRNRGVINKLKRNRQREAGLGLSNPSKVSKAPRLGLPKKTVRQPISKQNYGSSKSLPSVSSLMSKQKAFWGKKTSK